MRHEPGLLELNAQLDESTLKERPAEGVAYTSNPLSPFGSAGLGGLGLGTLSLLSTGWSRPDAQLKLILVPGGSDSLEGIMATNTIASEDSQDKLMLDAREVHLTRKLPPLSDKIKDGTSGDSPESLGRMAEGRG